MMDGQDNASGLPPRDLLRHARKAFRALSPRLGLNPKDCHLSTLSVQPEPGGGRVTLLIRPTEGEALVLKQRILPPGAEARAARRFEDMLAAHARLAEVFADAPGLGVPPLLAQNAAAGAVVIGFVPGQSVRDMLNADPGCAAEVLHRAGLWLRHLHGAAGGDSAAPDPIAALRRLRRRADAGRQPAPLRFTRLLRSLREAAEALQGVALPMRLQHGDMSAGNLMIAPGLTCGIDFETASAALPARDIAMLLTDCALMLPPSGPIPAGQVLPPDPWSAFFDGYGQGPGGIAGLDYALRLRLVQVWLS